MRWQLAGVAALMVVAGAAAYVLWGRPQVPITSRNDAIMLTDQTSASSLTLSIPAFADGGAIPAAYTCDGAGGSPAVAWSGVPAGAKSLALIVEDPDVPKALRPDGLFVHWVVYGIPASATGLPAGSAGGAMGENGRGSASYAPPCPPPQYEPSEHRYIFTLYALDTTPEFVKAPTKDELLAAMEGHIIATTTYTGRYARQ